MYQVRKKKNEKEFHRYISLLKWKKNSYEASYEVLKQEISKNETTEFVINQNEESPTYSAIQTPLSCLRHIYTFVV